MSRGNGVTTALGFDGASRLASLTNNLGGAATAEDVTQSFSCNPASQIATMASSNPAYDWTIVATKTDAQSLNSCGAFAQNRIHFCARRTPSPTASISS